MKKSLFFSYLVLMLLIISNANCKKVPPPLVNVAPDVKAGPDILLEIPVTHTLLSGTAHDANNNIKAYNWSKIAGPESDYIERPNDLSTKLAWLEEGEYEFELTATDRGGLFDKDTVKVIVFTQLKKYVLNNIARNASGYSIAQIPPEVVNNIKWVFAKSGGDFERADAGQNPNIDYDLGGGYYYELLPGNLISVYCNYPYQDIDVIIYY